jgi:magnesium chelatase subunit H
MPLSLFSKYEYLQIVENPYLFSSGLHTLGEAPNEEKWHLILRRYFSDQDNLPLSQTTNKLESAKIHDLLMQTTDQSLIF